MSTVAILYPGGLGAVLGKAIAQRGGKVITCLSGRSTATCDRASAAGFMIVPSLEEVLQQSELIISLVPPSAAVGVARTLARSSAATRSAGNSTPKPIYIDANSISPNNKRRIAQILACAGIGCVDGAFFGPTNQMGRDNVFALSGPESNYIAPFFRDLIEVRLVGDEIGQASALKMTLAIVTKALPALFLEMVCASGSQGQLATALELIRRLHPGIMEFLQRTIPTYPTHVTRRVRELEEVTDWLHDLGECGAMTQSAVGILERLRLAQIEPRANWPFDELLYRIAQTDLLRANVTNNQSGNSGSNV